MTELLGHAALAESAPSNPLMPALREWPSEACERSEANCRENFGIPLLVHILEERPYDSTTACAADALRAISMNNDENKNRVREAWAIPLLVQLLGSDVRSTALSAFAFGPSCNFTTDFFDKIHARQAQCCDSLPRASPLQQAAKGPLARALWKAGCHLVPASHLVSMVGSECQMALSALHRGEILDKSLPAEAGSCACDLERIQADVKL